MGVDDRRRVAEKQTSAGLGLFAPLFAIAGSTVGANLTLILADMARERSAVARHAISPGFDAAAPSAGGTA